MAARPTRIGLRSGVGRRLVHRPAVAALAVRVGEGEFKRAALKVGSSRFGIHLKNLSAKGASGLTDAPLEPGQVVFVELSRTVAAPAEVRWTRRSITGFAFLQPLSPDPRLMEVARWRSEDMVARNFFSHDLGGFNVGRLLRERQIPFNLANIAHDRGQYAEAERLYRRAVELEPGYADAHFYLALTLEKLGRSAEAKPHWRAYRSLDPRGEWVRLAHEMERE